MDRNKKHEEILDAALVVFSRFGFKKTTVEDIAEQVGMTKGNLYFYFKNKRELYEKAVGRALVQWRDYVAGAVVDIEDPVERFNVLCDRAFGYLFNHREIRALLVHDPNIFTLSRQDDIFREININAMMLLGETIEQGVRAGRFHPVDIPKTTEFIYSAYIMVIMKAHMDSEAEPTLDLYREASKLILRGLLKTDNPDAFQETDS